MSEPVSVSSPHVRALRASVVVPPGWPTLTGLCVKAHSEVAGREEVPLKGAHVPLNGACASSVGKASGAESVQHASVSVVALPPRRSTMVASM